MLRTIAIVGVLVASRVAFAQAPEPTGKHPRILLDDALRAAWKKQAKQAGSPVARAIERCKATRSDPKEYERDSYMGFDWGASLSACLIAWVVNGDPADAKSAVVYVRALLDDLEHLGDGKGGEKAVRRDTGYAIRSLPPYVAIAYDWLHDDPVMTPALKQHIRERLEEWISWYRKNGYHRHTPATNYHAGYLLSATLVAIALGGEGGDFATSLWKHVRDDIWGTDMKKALAPGGIFDGGDFPEGWQYAPLSVAEYALTARIAGAHGLDITGVDRWLTAMLVRTMHARSGARDTIAAIGDTEAKSASIPVEALTLLAILVGPSTVAAQRQALSEKNRLKLEARTRYLYEALAAARDIQPAAPAIDKWPTAYYARGIHTFYARTTWADQGVWMETICNPNPNEDADHIQPAAGNLVVTRGTDEVVIDPTPYGSLSTMTTNAPGIEAKKLPANYRPSQGTWGVTTHFVWAEQTASGVVATRCDYADNFRFQERSTEIDLALRDLIMIPWGPKRGDASIVVIDRAETDGGAMHLRFRSSGGFSLKGSVATAKIGKSTLAIHKVAPVAVAGEVRMATVGECWDLPRGQCDTARIPSGEYRITVPGDKPYAVHVLDVSGGSKLAIDSPAPGVTHLRRDGHDAYVATLPGPYVAAATSGAIHVITAPGAKVDVTKGKAGCNVVVTPGPSTSTSEPVVLVVDAACKATPDAKTGPAMPVFGDGKTNATSAPLPIGGAPTAKKRSGCCAAGGSGGESSALAFVVLVGLRRRRT